MNREPFVVDLRKLDREIGKPDFTSLERPPFQWREPIEPCDQMPAPMSAVDAAESLLVVAAAALAGATSTVLIALTMRWLGVL